MDLPVVLRAGAGGLLLAAGTIAGTLAAGRWLGGRLRVGRNASALISCGTAICGGSAVAAVASTIGADEGEVAVAMGVVFVLNAVALLAFPPAGHALGLSQAQFGTWAGVAIHDVSSVVAAAGRYGPRASETATAVKLSRALWIIPVTLAASFTRRESRAGGAQSDGRKRARRRPAVPWFVGLFLLASVARGVSPAVASAAPALARLATRGLTLTLFLVGAGLTRQTLRAVGVRPLVQAAVLWALISVTSLVVILHTVR